MGIEYSKHIPFELCLEEMKPQSRGFHRQTSRVGGKAGQCFMQTFYSAHRTILLTLGFCKSEVFQIIASDICQLGEFMQR